MASRRSRCPVMFLISLCLLVLFSSLKSVVCATNISLSVLDKQISRLNFFPARIEQLVEKQVANVFFNYSASGVSNTSLSNASYPSHDYVSFDVKRAIYQVSLTADDPSIAEVFVYEKNDVKMDKNGSQFTVRGNFLGRTFLKVSVRAEKSGAEKGKQVEVPGKEIAASPWHELPDRYKVSVVRKKSVLDTVFIVMVALLVICSNVGMGCKVDLKVVKEVLRRPLAPAVGFSCQFIIMPLIAFAAVRLLGLRGGVALGFFATGCAPGGGASNFYTYLLGADVSLSVTMTLVSIVASLAMIPLWLFTLGRYLTDEGTDIHIPFLNIIITLVSLLIPVAIGIILQHRRPNVAAIIVRCIRPFLVLFIVFMFTFGVYTNLYIFQLISAPLLMAGCMMPYVGFLLGGAFAAIAAQPLKRIVAIAIETGIQNTGIPILLMKYSLPQPDADISLVSPIVVAMFTPIPLWIAIGVVEFRRRCYGQSADREEPRCRQVICDSPIGLDAVTQNGDAKVATVMASHNDNADSQSVTLLNGDVKMTNGRCDNPAIADTL